MTPAQRAELAASMPAVVTIEGRALSPFNSCLVILQSQGRATIVGGFRQWIKSGRCVRKGQHGFSIWVPCGARKAEATDTEASTDGDTRTGFIAGTVFDVAQTDTLAATETEIEITPAQETKAASVAA